MLKLSRRILFCDGEFLKILGHNSNIKFYLEDIDKLDSYFHLEHYHTDNTSHILADSCLDKEDSERKQPDWFVIHKTRFRAYSHYKS